MATRTITVDDLTRGEIESRIWNVDITLTARPADGKPVTDDDEINLPEGGTSSVTWELSERTADAVIGLIAESNLADFVIAMRPMVKVTALDAEAVRKWARDHKPPIEIKSHGRIPAEIAAQYRREVVSKANGTNPVQA